MPPSLFSAPTGLDPLENIQWDCSVQFESPLHRISLLFENPKEVDQKEILLAYVRKAEEIIRQEPEYYLWSHRRWKHTRPEGIELTM